MEFFSGELNPIEMAKAEAERQVILQALKLFGGNKTKAAEYLKISRPLLHQKIKRLRIQEPDNKNPDIL
jgi:DNA-binding NtrC family response regulator